MFSIFYSKFLRYLDESSFFSLFTTFAKLASWLLISIILVNMPESKENLAMALKWHDFAIIKILTSFLLVFHIKSIISVVRKVWKSLMDELSGFSGYLNPHGEMYHWIPVVELVDYLFSGNPLGRTQFCDHFGVSRSTYDEIFSGLDSIQVFSRGASNARVLNPDYSRSDIASIISRASSSGVIKPLMKVVENGFSHKPSMPDIIRRSPTFVTRPVNSNSLQSLT